MKNRIENANIFRWKSRLNKLFLAIIVFALFLILCTTPSVAHVVSEHDEWIAIDSLDDITESGSYYLTKDVILTDTWSVPDGEIINLCLNGFVIKQTGEFGLVIEIYGYDTQLNLYDCSEIKHYFDKDEETGLWTLNDANKGSPYNVTGGVITGGFVYYGGGVYNDGGIFTMSGGNIVGNTANYGGGVINDGTFTMSGGCIGGNYAEYTGGGVYNQGTFIMRGGSIVSNSAGYEGGGVKNVHTFTMEGGSIEDNTAGENGGGVSNIGTFTMRGGSISGNTAEYGGGVCNIMSPFGFGTFTMEDGNIIGNTAEYGDGVYGSFTMTGDATVDGVYLYYDEYGSLSATIAITGYEFTGVASNIIKEEMTIGDIIVEIDPTSSLTASDILNNFRLADTSKSLIVSSDGKKLIVAEAAPAPKISGATLSLSTDIAVRFNVDDATLVGYSNPYIDVTFNGAEYKNIRAVHDAVAEKQRFTFRNISPAEMNDVIIAKLYATKDGESAPVLCDTCDYSIKEYCDNMLNKESTHSLLKTLCVDLLNYGSASQVYTGETDASKFANYTLTPEQKSWASTTITPAVRNDQSVSETGDNSVGVWRSASLNLYSDISLILKFTSDVDVSNLEAEIKYGVDLGETATVTGFTDSVYSGGDCKQIKFNNMNAQELNYPAEITLVDKTTGKRSKTLTYSVDAYSYSKIDGGGDLGALVTSIMKYIRSVDRFA